MKIFLTIINSVLAVMVATPTLSASCKITDSVYHDAENKGFELSFGPRIQGLGGSWATATIRNSSQALEYKFSLTQGNGYGPIGLQIIDPTIQGIKLDNNNVFEVYFFNNNLADATPGVFGREVQAPKYAFISGIGIYDYYQRKGPNYFAKENPLRDRIWVFERCQ